ncbi:MAG: hypothetical protein MUC38_07995 [Cyclobacteriaceae bacterium]|jgi:hypothetical protein|nr:hypothetical protein [Cyclobacteriaceae bacterium]
MRAKFLFFGAFLGGCGWLSAQSIEPKRLALAIKGEKVEGYSVRMEAKKGDVEAAWQRFLREFGKYRSNSDYFFVTEPVVDATPYANGVIYGKVEGPDSQPVVWLGIKDSEWDDKNIATVRAELEKLPYRFAVTYYRNQVQQQIDDTQRAVEATDKQQQRLVNQHKDLVTKLASNEAEKVRLQKAFEANALENAVLKQKLVDNKKAQDSVQLAGSQIKKVLDAQKEKQRKIN